MKRLLSLVPWFIFGGLYLAFFLLAWDKVPCIGVTLLIGVMVGLAFWIGDAQDSLPHDLF